MKQAALVLVALALTFGNARGMLPPRYGADLAVFAAGNVQSLDPVQARTPAERDLVVALFEGLVRRDGEGHAGVAATTWSNSANGRVWIFALRPGMTFTDGRPVHAADFVRSWARRDPSGRSHPLEGVTTVAADTLTLRIELTKPINGLLDSLSMPAAMVVRLDGGGGLVGSGPFRFAGTKEGAFTLGPRLDHHLGRPFPARVVMHSGIPPKGRIFDLVHGTTQAPGGPVPLAGIAGHRSPRLAGVAVDPLTETVRYETAWFRPAGPS
jgi:peptide/nickel transport system substrate-binding protein